MMAHHPHLGQDGVELVTRVVGRATWEDAQPVATRAGPYTKQVGKAWRANPAKRLD
jgi:hypothetical protein